MTTRRLPPLQGAPARPPVLPARRRGARRHRRIPPSLPRLMAHILPLLLCRISPAWNRTPTSARYPWPHCLRFSRRRHRTAPGGRSRTCHKGITIPVARFPSASGKRHKCARAPSLPLGGTQHVASLGSLASQPVSPGREVAPPALQHIHVQESSPAPMPRGEEEPGAGTPHSAPPRGLSLALLERVRRRELASRASTQLTLPTAAEEPPAAKRRRTRLDALHPAECQAAARVCNRVHEEPLRSS